LRFYLKERTSALHSQLDAIVGKLDTLKCYERYLRAALSFRDPLEKAVVQAQPLGQLGWSPKSIAGAIREDLDDLGFAVPASDHPAATIKNASQLVGTLYVLEGSALGARVLYKRAEALGLSAGFGARHLAGQAADRTSWPEFLAILDRRDESTAEDTARASLAAFEHALAAFKSSFHER
jgi:heme oxygenase (biliverdin-IX-beta and delta-forming)